MKTGLTLHHTAILFLPVIVSTLVAFTSGKRYVVKIHFRLQPTHPSLCTNGLPPPSKTVQKKNGPKNGLKNGIKKWYKNGQEMVQKIVQKNSPIRSSPS